MSSTEGAKANHPVSGNLQEMGDWEAEQAALDATRPSKPDSQQSKAKNKNPVVNLSAVGAENNAIKDMGTENWVGKLAEYRQSHKVGSPLSREGLTYHETTIGPPPHRFTCTVSIHETPVPMGGDVSFVLKKNAKRYAAKIAVEWLIEQKYMPNDGNINFPKPPPPQQVKKVKTPSQNTPFNNDPSAITISENTAPPLEGPSYASMVPTLCYKLGLGVPSYVVTQPTLGVPMYDAYAVFENDPSIEGKVGQVNNVFGKKNAKEAAAEVIVAFLRDIERQRNEMYEQEDVKRREMR